MDFLLQYIVIYENFYISEFYGQSAPDSEQIVLSYWLNKAALFKIYCDETPKDLQLSQASFYRNFGKYFGPGRADRSLPFVKISKYSSHSGKDLKYLNCCVNYTSQSNLVNCSVLSQINEKIYKT